MKAKTPVGMAEFSLDLKDDPARGLVADPESLKLQLPFLAKAFAGGIRKQLENLNELIAAHLNSRLDPAWTTSRLTLVGDKLQIRFTQKA